MRVHVHVVNGLQLQKRINDKAISYTKNLNSDVDFGGTTTVKITIVKSTIHLAINYILQSCTPFSNENIKEQR